MSELKDPMVLFDIELNLLAWNRTSLALIAFGFLIERAGLLLKLVSPNHAHSGNSAASFLVGLAFIALGVIAALYSARQYLNALKTLNSAEIPHGYHLKWGAWVNVTVAILGVALLGALFAVGV